MTSYTTKAAYPYPAPTDAIADYPSVASTFAGYLDNLPNRNRIINGSFDIWQRGTSFSNPATNTYTADRWVFTHNGTGGTRTIAPLTVNPGTTIGGMQARRALQMNITNAGSPAATSQTIGQRIEDVRTFAGESVTVSGWINNGGGGAGYNSVTLKAVQNFGTGGSPSAAVTTTIATKTVSAVWARFTATFTMPTLSGKTIGSDENSYVEIQFDVGGGTGTLYIWGIQVEQNTTATALEREPIQQTLAKCQRYFASYGGGAVYEPGALGQARSTVAADMMTFLPVEMRAVPSVSVSAAGDWQLSNGVSAFTCTSFSDYGIQQGRKVVVFGAFVGSGLTNGAMYRLEAQNRLTNRLNFAAEL